MLRSSLTLAWRNLRNHPVFTFINISGLAVGLAACWMIALFIQHELQYDRFLPSAERICQVNLSINMGGESGTTSNTPPPVGAALVTEFPEIEAYARVYKPGDVAVRRGNAGQPLQFITETRVSAVDSNFVVMFGYPMVAGVAASCLSQPNSVVLTESMARKYFGDAAPLGQVLYFDGQPRSVTGVLRDLPASSSLRFDFLAPIADYPMVKRFHWSWVWLQVDTWVRLRQPASPAALRAMESKFPAMVKRHAAAAFERIGQPLDEFLAKGGRWEVSLRPLLDVHLHTAGMDSRLQTLGDIRDVYVFGTVGAFILLLACVNFMNLSTARSAKRAKEVGVRKALGSKRSTLMGQFMAEAMLNSGLAAVLAIALTGIALPAFNRLTGEALPFSDLFSGRLWWLTAGLPVLAGLLGGLYPAFYLSGINAGSIFKNAFPGGKAGHAALRSGLVVFQFVVSVALVICTLIVFQQLSYTRHRATGLNRENVLVIANAQRLTTGQETFRQQLLQQSEVLSASLTTDLPAGNFFGDRYIPEQGVTARPVSKDAMLSSYLTDDHFVPTLGLRLLAGRNFFRDFPADSVGVILNETAVRLIGWEDPVGQYLQYPGNENQRFQVIGVVQDFHTASFRTAIQPFALFHQSSQTYALPQAFIAVRLHPGQEKTMLQKAETLWKAASPDTPFDYSFLDANYAALYRSEEKMGSVLGLFTVLSLFVGCLGLFALAAFTAEQRTKEIGIRKVLGASVGSITGLLTRDFLALVIVAIAIASPIAYYCMQRWLADFAYRIDMQWWMFVAAGLAAIAIAFLTVGFQSVKAALANPARSLRSE